MQTLTKEPPHAKLHRGVWLPDIETHLVDMMTPGKKAYAELPDGRAAYQRHKYLALMEHVPADRRRVFVDIGAHVGLWSMQAELDFKHIIAFEPQPLHADIYPANVDRRAVLIRTALGERDGSVALQCEPTSTGDTHVVGEGNIPMQTLDSFGFDVVDVIKIDTEGYELPILKGSVKTIQHARPIICVEQKGREVMYQGGKRDEAVSFLRDLGMVPLRPPISGDHFMGWPA